jgi:hypothetical protein
MCSLPQTLQSQAEVRALHYVVDRNNVHINECHTSARWLESQVEATLEDTNRNCYMTKSHGTTPFAFTTQWPATQHHEAKTTTGTRHNT